MAKVHNEKLHNKTLVRVNYSLSSAKIHDKKLPNKMNRKSNSNNDVVRAKIYDRKLPSKAEILELLQRKINEIECNEFNYTGPFNESQVPNGVGIVICKQGGIGVEYENGVMRRAEFYSAVDNNLIYTLETLENGVVVIRYFLSEQSDSGCIPDLIATIDDRHVLCWYCSNETIDEVKIKANTVLNSFDRISCCYDKLLANLSLINTNDKVVQFINNYDLCFNCSDDFQTQLDKFINFAKEQKQDKVIMSRLIATKFNAENVIENRHSVGVIYTNGNVFVVDTSGALYKYKDAINVLNNKNNCNLLVRKIQGVGNCILLSKLVTNEFAKNIADGNMDINSVTEYFQLADEILSANKYAQQTEWQLNTLKEGVQTVNEDEKKTSDVAEYSN